MYGFVDEYGTSELDTSKDGVSSCFVISCVLVKDDEIEVFKQGAEDIRSKYFQTGEIKSSKVGRNHKRRLIILDKVVKLPFSFYALVIDKEKIEGQGLGYKKTSLKFFHKILYDQVVGPHPSIKISMDEHGSKPFMDGFKDYLERRVKRNGLFSASEFLFEKSTDSTCVQIADFLSGTIGFIYDRKKQFPKKREVVEILGSKVVGIKEWPLQYDHSENLATSSSSAYDEKIAKLSVRLAQQYLQDNESKKDQVINDRVKCLYRLLYHFIYISKSQYLPRYLLMEAVQGRTVRNLSQHYFRTKIIAKLRDAGVIISSSRSGYKLPASEDDIDSYLESSSRVVKPMMSRIGKCREKIMVLTNGEYDILNDSSYEQFKAYLESGVGLFHEE